jgi:hypothetical protein
MRQLKMWLSLLRCSSKKISLFSIRSIPHNKTPPHHFPYILLVDIIIYTNDDSREQQKHR